jgi:signal transduction histidine kinase
VERLRAMDDDRVSAGLDQQLAVVKTVQRLSMASSFEEIQEIVRTAARQLTGADGATLVLRDADKCFYVDEDAIAPLWKGSRFPLETCISGWAMLNAQSVAIPDIYVDDRIPIDAYRPTFVKSLVMVPIRTLSPVGAIGNYWAQEHVATDEELQLLQALADSTAVAMENVAVRAELEQRVARRTAELEERNHAVELLVEELNDQAADLQSASREQDRLIRHLAHEVRGPLYAGDGLLELLLGEGPTDPDDQLQVDLGSIRSTIHEALRVVDEQLESARLRSGAMRDLRPEPVDLNILFAELRGMYRALQRDGDVQLRVHVAPGMPDLVTDRHFLMQILRNLVTNAAKFTDDGEIKVRARREDADVVIAVSDTGIGIPAEDQERIFREFEQIDGAQASRRAGTGLGLPLVRRLTATLGGTLSLDSEPGRGTTFTLRLPAVL